MCAAAKCVIGAGSLDGILKAAKEALAEVGIDFEDLVKGRNGGADSEEGSPSAVKVVCVSPNLKESVEEMGASSRDQVVMVRMDADTSANLDAWVETGAAKSRSEAAALFIREGLKVRASELDRLEDALRDVRRAKTRLQEEARETFGLG